MTKIFSKTGTFEAIREAESWLRENDYSWGSMQRDDPIGILKGDHDIPKWRYLTAEDKKILDGVIRGEKRHGPVTIEIYEDGDA